MTAPRVLAQIVILGGQILFKSSQAAWRQVAANMKSGGGAMGGTASSANVGSGDVVSRRFRMTTDEAANILNLKKEAIFKAEGPSTEVLEELLANYERMMKANAQSSHYIQSKIVRAKERIEAELPATKAPPSQAPVPPEAPTGPSS